MITANIPAQKLGARTYASHTKSFQRNEAGQWFIDFAGDWEKVTEAEVIDQKRYKPRLLPFQSTLRGAGRGKDSARRTRVSRNSP